MYINKIDELIDKIIDDFYLTTVSENKTFQKILQDVDYIKYQKEINNIMIEYTRKINIKEIQDLVKSNNAVHQIFESLKKYIAFYMFLTIGFFYTEKEDLFINNIIEFTKNQTNYNYKIENFFNSDTNSLLIKYNKIVSNIINILNADQSKIDKMKIKPEFTETIKFLNELGGDYIANKFQLKNLKNSVGIQAHNIIKTLIIVFLYKKTDKKDFFKMLEASEITEGDYMFIDIVVPIKKTIDYSAIEKILESATFSDGDKTKTKNLPYYIWKYFTEYDDNKTKPPLSHDEKIIRLINSGILIPISDDFLLYHKDSENYDKVIDETKVKKKEDTKIKYIINKIDKVKEYYSEQIKNDDKSRSEIKKIFYPPLLSRKAILINVKEDINIINKFINMGKQNVENLDYFRDLEQYKLYPYINFNDFEKYGMTVQLSKTIDVVRYVSFAKSGEFKQLSSNNIIQTRVGSKDMLLNIVGFMIPSTKTPLQCIPIKNVIDIRTLAGKENLKQQNGVYLILDYLRETYMNIRKHISSVTWIFDEEKDNISEESYEQESKFSMQDRIKHIVAYLYDKIQDELLNIISNVLSKEKITIQEGYEIIDYFKKNIFDIPQNSDIHIELEKKLFSLIEKLEPYYDKKEDFIYGLEEEDKDKNKKIKKPKNNIPIVKINLSSIDEYGEIKENIVTNGICQHNITQDKIASINKKDFTKYSEELYKFIQQYVILNVNNDPICKSCGANLDIKKYIEEGEFDNDTKTFVSYSTPININLEDIIGYEKFKIAIRQMDKLIEKIATVSNILHLIKGSITVRSKRKLIIKNTIDLINNHNKKIKIARERKEKNSEKQKNYGVNKNYSNMWNFELVNDIFVFSSKDIDVYKPIKTNNVIVYLIFFILMEITESHVMYMGDDKKKHCNFSIFDKAMEPLFGGLKIISNNKGDTKNITDYKILCYMIYIIACTITTSTKMWYFNPPKDAKKGSIIPMMQKSIIHTLIDVINSVLEVAIGDGNNEIIYKMLTARFFKKMQTVFNDEDLYKRLKKDSVASSSGDKKASILVTQGYVKLTGKYKPMDFLVPERRICKCPTMQIPKLEYIPDQYHIRGISNISNCDDGNFHEFKPEKNTIVCIKCKKNAKDINYNEKTSLEIKGKFKDILNSEFASQICLIDGMLHTFEISESGENICQKCKKREDSKYSDEEIKQIQDLVIRVNEEKSKKMFEMENGVTEFSNKKLDYINTAVGKLKSEFNKDKKIGMEFLGGLMDEIQKTIGNEFHNFHLTENLYIIDHDHIGNMLEKNIVILESQKKMMEKQNHPFFKTNVLYYTNHKYGKIDVFYDATTKILLGYKEENKNFILNKKYDRRIKLSYSILNKIKLLGYKTPFINIESMYQSVMENRNNINTDNNIISQKIIINIINDRITQLKKVILNLKIILSRILNGHNDEISADEYHKSKINQLIEKYKKKIINPIINDKSGNNTIFKHWKAITNGINIENIDNIKLDYDFSKNKILSFEEINKIDNAGNLLTYFIYKELSKFFEYNDNKVLKSFIAHFIVDFVNTIFDIFNEEKDNSNVEIKRFVYLLTSITHIEEIEEKSGAQNLEGIYSEYQDSDEEKTSEEKEQREEQEYDNIQENEAYDIDVDQEDIMEEGEERMQEYDLSRTLAEQY
jgi:hypothetical protein